MLHGFAIVHGGEGGGRGGGRPHFCSTIVRSPGVARFHSPLRKLSVPSTDASSVIVVLLSARHHCPQRHTPPDHLDRPFSPFTHIYRNASLWI